MEKAINEYREALKINPKEANVHTGLGAALGALGRHKEAIKEFKEALKLNPKYTMA